MASGRTGSQCPGSDLTGIASKSFAAGIFLSGPSENSALRHGAADDVVTEVNRVNLPNGKRRLWTGQGASIVGSYRVTRSLRRAVMEGGKRDYMQAAVCEDHWSMARRASDVIPPGHGGVV